MSYFKYIYNSLGKIGYLLDTILLFISGSSIYDRVVYGDDLLGLYIVGGLSTIYLTVFYVHYKKDKKNKTTYSGCSVHMQSSHVTHINSEPNERIRGSVKVSHRQQSSVSDTVPKNR